MALNGLRGSIQQISISFLKPYLELSYQNNGVGHGWVEDGAVGAGHLRRRPHNRHRDRRRRLLHGELSVVVA